MKKGGRGKEKKKERKEQRRLEEGTGRTRGGRRRMQERSRRQRGKLAPRRAGRCVRTIVLVYSPKGGS